MTFRDITAHQQVEAILHRQEAHFRSLIEQTSDLVIVLSDAGIIRYIGPSSAEILGYTPAEVEGEHAWTLVHPEDVPQTWTAFVHALQYPGVVHTATFRFRHKDGTWRTLEARGKPLSKGAEGGGYVINARDITERLQLEAQLRQGQTMEALGAMAGGIAHDFTTILGVILGYTALTLDDIPPASPAWRNLHEVLAAGARARDLVRHLRLFSHQSEPARKPVALPALIQEVLPLLRTSLPSTVAIHQEIAPDVGAVLADPTQMQQILLHLCADAAQAMQETGGVLAIQLTAVAVTAAMAAIHPALTPGPHVRLTVRDTGHGMPPEVLEHLFGPFCITKGVGAGTGPGLATVHRIVVNHGGAITVTSPPGQGTTCTIYLPCTDSATLGAPRVEPVPRGTGCVLLVDAEEALAHLGQHMLEHLGYEAVVRTRGSEALEAFRTAPQRFAVVLTAHTMPDLTGEMLARALRRIRPDIPIILCTEFSHTMTAERACALGFEALLMKPLVLYELGRTLQHVLAPRGG